MESHWRMRFQGGGARHVRRLTTLETVLAN